MYLEHLATIKKFTLIYFIQSTKVLFFIIKDLSNYFNINFHLVMHVLTIIILDNLTN